MEFSDKTLESNSYFQSKKLDQLLIDCTDLENKAHQDIEKVITYENLNLKSWRRMKSDLSIDEDDFYDKFEYQKGQEMINRLIYNRYVQDFKDNEKIEQILESTISPISSVKTQIFKFDNLSNLPVLKQFSKHKRKFGEVWKPTSKPKSILTTHALPNSCKNESNITSKPLGGELNTSMRLRRRLDKNPHDNSAYIFSTTNHKPFIRTKGRHTDRTLDVDTIKINQMLSETMNAKIEYLPEISSTRHRNLKVRFKDQNLQLASNQEINSEILRNEYYQHQENLENKLSLEKMIISSSYKEKKTARMERQSTKAFTKMIREVKH